MGALIKANLDLCRTPEDEIRVVIAEAGDFLRASSRKKLSWDIVFFDPPYASDYTSVLSLVGNRNGELLAENGWLIVEQLRKNQLPEEIGALRRRRILKQGDSALSFYERL